LNDILKQRLVGALVLIALGVLFWPVLFVDTERQTLDRESQVAPMPRLDEADIPAPRPLDNVPPVARADAMRLEAGRDDLPPPEPREEGVASASAVSKLPGGETPDKDAASTKAADAPEVSLRDAPDSPTLDEEGIPIAWVLQVASMSTRAKADALVEKLIADGHKAYHRAIQRDGDMLYRVFIGPVFEREKLGPVKRSVDAEFKVNTLITRYVP
jgi:DedD protein